MRQDFDSGSVELVLARLSGLELPFVESESARERVQAAIVLTALGSYAAFTRSAALAETDWRDILVAAGLANDDWPERLDERLGP